MALKKSKEPLTEAEITEWFKENLSQQVLPFNNWVTKKGWLRQQGVKTEGAKIDVEGQQVVYVLNCPADAEMGRDAPRPELTVRLKVSGKHEMQIDGEKAVRVRRLDQLSNKALTWLQTDPLAKQKAAEAKAEAKAAKKKDKPAKKKKVSQEAAKAAGGRKDKQKG